MTYPNQHQPPQQGPQQPYGYGQQPPPNWGGPQPPMPPQQQGMSTGSKVGIGCVGAFALVLILGIGASLAGGGDDDPSSKTPAADVSSSAPATQAEDEKASSKPEKAKPAPIAVKAVPTKYAPSVLADGKPHTSVKVTVTNNSGKTIDINPLYFSITDTNGTRHTAELGVDERQMETTELAPGENITGVITGKGAFTAKTVTYKDGFIGDSVRADVK
ncbi:DUF4352 domain-containing protein [Streptomyces sp. NPDC051940]|uniref:DUF4352 domain-containing protein n=1 Tax=Streptomyces sp. NPDC051940 TaxID=3155675 RepID=UPI00342C38AD